MPQKLFFQTCAFDVQRFQKALISPGAISMPLLTENFRQKLLREAKQKRFAGSDPIIESAHNRVLQHMEHTEHFAHDSQFRILAKQFQVFLHLQLSYLARYPFETEQCFNEMVLLHYPGNTPVGISAHLDGSKYINLICLVTLDGDCDFEICEDKDGKKPVKIDASPGRVILMRAPGFIYNGERPYHRVINVRAGRYSFGLRQDSKLQK